MKKLIAMLACLTLVVTMFAGLTVCAAEKATMTATFKDYVTSGENVIARVEVFYSVPDTMVPFTSYEDEIMMETYWSGTGVAASQFGLKSSDAGFTYFNAAKSSSPLTTSTALANKSGLLFSAGTTHANCVATGEGLLGVVMFKVDPASYANSTEITFSGDEFISVRKVVNNTASVTEYRLATSTIEATGCTIPAYETPASDYDVAYAENSKVIFNTAPTTTTDGDVTFNVTPAMGYKISNVTATSGTVDTSYSAAGGDITVNDVAANTTITVSVAEADDTIVTYATALKEGNVVYVFGKVPASSAAGTYGMFVKKDGAALAVPSLNITDGKFAATNPASEGAFGIQLTISGDYYKGAYTAATYLGSEIDAESVAFSIN